MPFASINGTRLYYEDTGGTGTPVVFSHGLLWSCRMFDAQVRTLSAAGYRCIAYDHRGQGQSEEGHCHQAEQGGDHGEAGVGWSGANRPRWPWMEP